jgi:hypothetical protein
LEDNSLHNLLYLWLQPLLKDLRQKGFAITPDTHVQVIRVLEYNSHRINDPYILLDYIAPLVAKNTEQLNTLKEAYPSYIRDQFTDFPLPVDAADDQHAAKEPSGTALITERMEWLISQAKKLLMAVVLLAAVLVGWYLIKGGVSTVSATMKISHDGNVRNAVSFDALSSLQIEADTQFVQFHWSFGDGSVDSSSYQVKHLYASPGSYNVSLRMKAKSQRLKLARSSADSTIMICPPPLLIDAGGASEVITGRRIRFSVRYDSGYAPVGQNIWFINDTVVQRNSLELIYTFNTPGIQSIRFSSDSVGKGGAGCNSSVAVLRLQSRNPDGKILRMLGSGPVVLPSSQLSSFWIWIFLLVGGVSLVTVLVVKGWYEKANAKSRLLATKIINRFKGTDPPHEIPFQNHEELIEDERDLVNVAKTLMRRNIDIASHLNIKETIALTIRSEGLPKPVYSNKTRPVEYLFLIDKNKPKSLQVHLFEYLLKKFSQNDIYIETFYFLFEPDVCRNPLYPNGIHVSRLYDLYPNHIVVILGTGYQFIDKNYPSFRDDLLQLFKRWDRWSICTPVSYTDWDYREAILQKTVTIFPADLESQLKFFPLLQESARTNEKDLHVTGTSGVKKLNAQDATQLRTYLGNEFLFQWLCALAVYPRVSWPVTIFLGNALQKANYPKEHLNFSALLKMVRIPWMQEGSFPDNLRLDLLKLLEPKNELVARTSMIRLMDEAAHKIDETNLSFEELEMQRLTDKFLVYAQDPQSEGHKGYEDAHNEFKVLWEQGKVFDYPLSAYLSKSGGKGQWPTLISNRDMSSVPARSVPIDKFFPNSMLQFKKKGRRLTILLLSLASMSFLLLITLWSTARYFSGSNVDKKLRLTAVNREFPFRFSLAFDECFLKSDVTSDSTSLIFRLPGSRMQTLNARDSFFSFSLPYSFVKDSVVKLSVLSSDVRYRMDTSFQLNNSAIGFSISGNCETIRLRNKAGAINNNMMLRKSYDAVLPEMADALKPVITEKAFNLTLDSIVRTFGEFLQPLDTVYINDNGLESFTMRNKFQNGEVTNQITFNKDGKVSGLFATPSAYELRGRVSENNVPVSNARISFAGGLNSVTTDRNGGFRLTIPSTSGEKVSFDVFVDGIKKHSGIVNSLASGVLDIKLPVIDTDAGNDGMKLSSEGINLYQQGKYEEAIEKLKLAVSLNPSGDAISKKFIGHCYYELDDYKLAILYYTQALNTKNKYFSNSYKSDCYLFRGYSKEQIGDQNGACTDFLQALKLGNDEAREALKNCK